MVGEDSLFGRVDAFEWDENKRRLNVNKHGNRLR
jgi:hypothetical protein